MSQQHSPQNQPAPGQGFHGHQAPVPPPPAVPKKKPIYKRWWFLAVLVLVVLGGIVNALGDDEEAAAPAEQGQSTPATDAAPSEGQTDGQAETGPEESAPARAGIGDPVVSGDLQLVVENVDDPVAEIGSEYFNTAAQGEFVVMTIAVTNVGDEPKFFMDSSLTLLAGGKTFNPDSSAPMYLEDRAILFDEINPGNTLKGAVVFDLPVGTSLETLEFEGGLFDKAVSVALG